MEAIKFRCSMLGSLMTEPREKTPREIYHDLSESLGSLIFRYGEIKNKETKSAKNMLAKIQDTQRKINDLAPEIEKPYLSKTCRTQLRRIWIGETYNRWKSIDTKFIRKGNKQEEEALTLLSMFDKKMYVKNQQQFSNDYLTGTPDIIHGDETIDTKCSWDIFTFYNSVDDDLDTNYEWQGRGYNELLKCVRHTVAYCLVNTPDDEITNELYRDSFNWQGNEAPLWAKILKVSEMIYDKKSFDRFLLLNDLWPSDNDTEAMAIVLNFKEVPLAERVHKKSFHADPDKITELYSRLDECRTLIQSFQ